MSATSLRSDSNSFVGATSTGSVIVIVVPMLPRSWFIAMAIVWTTGGWSSPAITTLAPRLDWRSFAIAATAGKIACPPPSAVNNPRAKPSTSDARIGMR